ncbi:MAG: TIGR00266 family protein [Chloroflexota bacterium]|nr:MAG: TIGR00266 family protein [Chloroflexota bacterium]
MNVDVRYGPAYALAMVTLDHSETIHVESGAMVGMSPRLNMETAAKGGFLKSLGRSMFGGESFFLNTFTATSPGETIALAPPLPGDVAVIEMHGETLMVQSGSYLASSEGIEVETKWSGAKTFFGSEGLIMLRISGTGTLIVSSYGAIHHMELGAGEEFIVDTGHLVTFDDHLQFNVKKVAGWKSTLFSGEGLVIELKGPGDLTLQSRSQDSFLSWLIPQLPKNTSYD